MISTVNRLNNASVDSSFLSF